MVIENARDAVSPTASVTSTTKSLAPASVGVPVSAAVPPSSAIPLGRLPSTTVHAYGSVPEAATIASE